MQIKLEITLYLMEWQKLGSWLIPRNDKNVETEEPSCISGERLLFCESCLTVLSQIKCAYLMSHQVQS